MPEDGALAPDGVLGQDFVIVEHLGLDRGNVDRWAVDHPGACPDDQNQNQNQ